MTLYNVAEYLWNDLDVPRVEKERSLDKLRKKRKQCLGSLKVTPFPVEVYIPTPRRYTFNIEMQRERDMCIHHERILFDT